MQTPGCNDKISTNNSIIYSKKIIINHRIIKIGLKRYGYAKCLLLLISKLIKIFLLRYM